MTKIKSIKPAIGEIYHVYNRGVEKREIFTDDSDRKRFLHDLYIFNDDRPIINNNRAAMIEVRLPSEREKMVEIFAFVLMPNHFHLMLKQITENGITEFMRKIGTGYTNYFNTKYQRVGPLFQGKYKAAYVAEDRHFLFLPHYIHSNPLNIEFGEYKNNNLDAGNNLKKLDNYKWSSYVAYVKSSDLPYNLDLLDTVFLDGAYGNISYKTEFTDWLNNYNINEVEEIALD